MDDQKAKILYNCLLVALFLLLIAIAAFLFEYTTGDLALSQQSRLYIFLILGVVIGVFSVVTALFFTRNLEWNKRRVMAWAIFSITLVVNGFFGIIDLVGTTQDVIPFIVYSFSITMGSLAFGFLFSKPWPSHKGYNRIETPADDAAK